METRKVEKIASLVIAVLVMVLSFYKTDLWEDVGIYAGCGLSGRFLYSFFHANFLHAALNVWCFLSVMFIYDVSIWRLLLAFAVASSFPVNMLHSLTGGFMTPTVGLSAVVFFLFASISFEVVRKWYYQGWMLFYLVIGFIFPNTNAVLHLYCYLCGFLYALLNKPIKISR